MKVAQQHHLTFNDDKCEYSKTSIDFLGYTISSGTLRPDPERLCPLKELPVPMNTASLRRCVGLFSYYSHWLPRFSERIRPLAESATFPLSAEAVRAFGDLKDAIAESVVHAADELLPFVVEMNASNHVIAATLNQSGQLVAFFSWTLSPSEQRHSAIEKEAYVIVEALRKWRHYLLGRHFKLITDQKSVSFMFDNVSYSRTKNDKIQHWRLELSCFKYDIVYCAGRDNIPADTFSRTCASANDGLQRLHNDLCHPGVSRLAHFVRLKNLPHLVGDVRCVISECKVCAELKPNFFKPLVSHLIKATQPFERLNVDFKGPLPTSNRNSYLLTIVDEFTCVFLSLLHVRI